MSKKICTCEIFIYHPFGIGECCFCGKLPSDNKLKEIELAVLIKSKK